MNVHIYAFFANKLLRVNIYAKRLTESFSTIKINILRTLLEGLYVCRSSGKVNRISAIK